MYLEKHIPNKKPGEELVLFIRRHWLVVLSEHLFFIALCFVPVILYFFIESAYPAILFPSHNLYALMILLASLYYLYIWLFLYNTFIDYYLDVWIVTNKRIINIEQKGLFNRVVSEQTLDKIQDVTSELKGILPTLFSYGDVFMQTAAAKERFVFKQVSNPRYIAKKIINLVHNLEKEELENSNQTKKER